MSETPSVSSRPVFDHRRFFASLFFLLAIVVYVGAYVQLAQGDLAWAAYNAVAASGCWWCFLKWRTDW